MKKAVPAFALLSLLLSSPVSAQGLGYQVIVHPDNPADSLASTEVAAYLLKKKGAWPDGVAVEPVDLADGSSVREALSLDVHNRSTSKIVVYWQRQIFSGREVPPPKLATDADVVAYVASHPGAIGYVSPGTRTRGAKKVDVLKSPRTVDFSPPEYTAKARARGEEGTVVLRLTIDAAGHVTDVEVLKGLKLGLTEQAVKAARSWTYEPARRNGKPVKGQLDVNIRFDPGGSGG